MNSHWIDTVQEENDSLRLDGNVTTRFHKSLMSIVFIIQHCAISAEIFDDWMLERIDGIFVLLSFAITSFSWLHFTVIG